MRYEVQNLSCAHCATRIEDSLRKLVSVRRVNLNFAASSLDIDCDDMGPVEEVIRSIEPDVKLSQKREAERHEHPVWLYVRLGLSFAMGVAGFFIGAQLEEWGLSLPWFAAAWLCAGFEVVVTAGRNILRGSVFDENFLMSIATIGALALGAWEEALGVMIFYQVGEILQDRTVEKSRASIRSLAEFQTSTHVKLVAGERVVTAAETLIPGDRILLRPGDRVSVDAIVIQGSAFFDCSAINGEATPARIGLGKEVSAGFVVRDGVCEARVLRPAAESSAARILALVEDAASRKSSRERFVTRFARVYTPIVCAIAALVAVVPPLVFSQSWHDSVYRALVLLVISCPCALVIGVPLAYFAGIAAAARRGILVKGSQYMDALAACRTVVFDKTGTLSTGEFAVQDVKPSQDISRDELLQWAASAEQHSPHPIAKALVLAWQGERLNFDAVEERAGFGVVARNDEGECWIGNTRLMAEIGANTGSDSGAQSVHVARRCRGEDLVYLGSIDIGDAPRQGIESLSAELEAVGVERTAIISGDSHHRTKAFAEAAGIHEAWGDLLPADKLARMEQFCAEGATAMVGDGLNDAAVLARADVGITLAQRASDAVLESADVVLLSDKATASVAAIRAARKTRSVVLSTVTGVLVIKVSFLALGSLGLASMGMAIFADVGTALLAVANAMRLR